MFRQVNTLPPIEKHYFEVFAASVVIRVVVTVQAVHPKVVVIIPESFNERYSTKSLLLENNIFNVVQSPHVDIAMRKNTHLIFIVHMVPDCGPKSKMG